MFWGYSAKLTPPGRSGKAVYGTFTQTGVRGLPQINRAKVLGCRNLRFL